MNDLLDRTLNFGVNIYQVSRKIRKESKEFSITDQIIRSSSSVGANYYEAQNAFSKKDFLFKISICHKEVLETIFWLKFMRKVNLYSESDYISHLDEAEQLNKIFATIIMNGKSRK